MSEKNRSLLERLRSASSRFASARSQTFCLGATLTVAVVGIWSSPVIAETAYAATPSQVEAQTLLTKQQRRGRWIEIDLSRQRLVAWNVDVLPSLKKEGILKGCYEAVLRHASPPFFL
ncbi:MAG: hypothetical protein LDL41_23430, partial [Coleofasciculus sp. S288]|nr:hypothetical protein [Coleofasciculus sp. S288]